MKVSWRQKSRATWLKDGDKNMKFFYCMTNIRRKINFISTSRIRKGNDFTNKADEVEEEIADSFEGLYSSVSLPRPSLKGVLSPSILDSLRAW